MLAPGVVVVLEDVGASEAGEPLVESGVHLPAPPGLVVAINPSAASVSASFSPSQIQTFAPVGAASSSGSRYGIAGPLGLPLSQRPFSQ